MKKSTKIYRQQCAGRKPIRPVERQKMRPWLGNLLLNHDVPSLQWEVKKEGTFRISWRHAARQGWNPRDDADLFERWARHTGKYVDGDDPDPKRWKANFRCALNSLPDVEELKDKGLRKGNNAFKIYKFLDEKKHKSRNRQTTVNNSCRGSTCEPKRISKRLQDKPGRSFVYCESEEDVIMSDSDESHTSGIRDSDEISTSGSEPDFISERNCRLSTESSELPVFEKICGESDLSIFQNDQSYEAYQKFLQLPGSTISSSLYEEDSNSVSSDITEEELYELIIRDNTPSRDIIIKEEMIDIWSSVAADVTIGGEEEMKTDITKGCIIQETENVITEQLKDNTEMVCYTSLDLSLL